MIGAASALDGGPIRTIANMKNSVNREVVVRMIASSRAVPKVIPQGVDGSQSQDLVLKRELLAGLH